MSAKYDLIAAIFAGNLDSVSTILGKAKKAHKYHDDALIAACSKDSEEIVCMLIEKGVNLNCTSNTGHTPLMVATINHKPEIAKRLIEAGCNIDQKNFSATLYRGCTAYDLAKIYGNQTVANLIESDYQQRYFEQLNLQESIEDGNHQQAAISF